MLNSEIQPPKIRSFIRRQGRLTAGQQTALDKHWDKYVLAPDKSFDAVTVFGRQAPLILEIGFGNGETLAAMAAANPAQDYLGVEVHRPGVGHLLMLLEQQGIPNVRVYCHDAVEVLEHCIPDDSLAGLHLFFPDPWPKKKHHKRRIVRPDFLAVVFKKLAGGGYFHAATDWQPYAESMLETFAADGRFKNASATQNYCERPDYRPLTKFERRGIKLGHGVWDLIFIKEA